jgi:glycosyltransferase involved in cell wall biosynthesis
MRFDTILSPEMSCRVEEIGTTDILLAVPTLDSEATINSVIETAIRAIELFPGNPRATLLVADGGSSDRTCEIVGEIPVSRRHEKIIGRYSRGPGKAYALRTIFEIASRLWAKATVVVDPRMQHIPAQDICRIAGQILEKGCDLACPAYRRNPFDAPYVKFLAYPLFRALYGPLLKDPAPPDFAFSGNLAKTFFVKKSCESPHAGSCTELWLPYKALMEEMRVCSVPISQWAPDFSEYKVHVFFDLMELNPNQWKKTFPPESEGPVESYGYTSIPPAKLEIPGLWLEFRRFFSETRELIAGILSKDTLEKFEKASDVEEEQFYFSPELWARIVLEFALSYHHLDHDRGRIIQALVPFQIARLYSFFKMMGGTAGDPDAIIEEQARAFEKQKPYLVENWK